MVKPVQNQYAKEQHEIEHQKLKNKVTILYFVLTMWFLLTVGYLTLYTIGVK